MPLQFSDYNLRIAQRRVDARKNDDAEVNLAFYRGDHWQNGDAYIGPRLPTDDARYPATILEIERTQVSRNAIGEIVDNHVNGVLGRELAWKFSVDRTLGKVPQEDPLTKQTIMVDEQPTDDEKDVLSEAEQVLTVWWDKQEVPKKLQDMDRLSLLANRAPLRLHVIPGALDEDGNIPKSDMPTALAKLWLQHLGTNEDTLEIQFPSATVYTDKRTRKDIGIFTYKEAVETLEGTQEGEDRAELCYVEDDFKDPKTGEIKKGNTVLRIIGNEGDKEPPVSLPLGGRLTMYEMTRRPLIGKQIVSQQKALNLAETMKRRNIEMAGFRERYILNADMPGRMVTGSDGVARFLPDTMQVGAATTNLVNGIKYKDAQGNEQITTPVIVFSDPVPVTTFSETSDGAYLAILQDAHQTHLALAGDAVVSAASRIQAQDSFQKDLLLTAGKVEAAARWVLETALAMAAHFSGQSERFAGLRAVVQCRIDAGPITADDKRTAADMVDRGLWSRETAMSATGIEDVDGEKERIDKEQAQKQQTDAANMVAVQRELNKVALPVQGGANGANGTGKQPVFPGG